MRRLSESDCNHEFDLLYTADTSDPAEWAVRYLLLSLCAVAVWFVTRSWFPVVWIICYFSLSLPYIWLLRRIEKPVSQRKLVGMLFWSTSITCCFSAMPVFVATLGGGEYIILAMCGCACLALNMLTRNQGLSYAVRLDLVVTLITAGIVFIFAILHAEQVWTKASTTFGGIAVILYFLLTFFQIIAVSDRLSEKLKAEAQSLKMRSLGQLTSGIAHDFNNLLTVIGGNIELFKIDPYGPESLGYLEEAEKATQRSAALISNLLAYSRKSNLQTARYDVRHLLRRIDAMLLRVLPATIVLKITALKDKGQVEVDIAMFESAILNLVINARDALDGEIGEIVIETRLSEDGKLLVLSVEDDGPGIEPAILEDATNPFFTTKEVGTGSGLGLSMVKGFAEQSGGSFEISNRVPKGFRACIYLPVVEAAQGAEAQIAPSVLPASKG